MKKKDMRILREKVLSDCRPDTGLWTCHGSVIRNLYELVGNIEALNEWAFHYHVNDDNQKNDFAKWIREVLEDNQLAGKLEKIRDQKKYVKIIKTRIKELEAS